MDTRPQILVVEDDPILRQFVMQALAAGGCTAAGVESAGEAILACERCGYDLIVSDVVMEEMSGPELAVRLWERRPALPVLFMSGQEPEILEGCGYSGSTLIEMPFDISRFLSRVRLALAGAHP